MAKILSQTGIATGETIKASEISQSIDAFTGVEEYDITISGSLELVGTISASANIIAQSFTGSLSGSVSTATTASYAITASHALNGGNDAFPFSGSAVISPGSLLVDGNISASGEMECTKFIANAAGGFEFEITGSNQFNMKHTVADKSMFFTTATGTGTIDFGTNNTNSQVSITSAGNLGVVNNLTVDGIISGSEIVSTGNNGIKSMGRFLDVTVPRGSDAQRTRYDFNKQEGGVTVSHGNSDFSVAETVFSYTTASNGFRIFQPLTVTGQISGSGRIHGEKLIMRNPTEPGSVDIFSAGGIISASGAISASVISSAVVSTTETSLTILKAKETPTAPLAGLTIGNDPSNEIIHVIGQQFHMSSSAIFIQTSSLPNVDPGVRGQLFTFEYDGVLGIGVSQG